MSRSRVERTSNIWPGFVDALATLLLVITFLLAVFVLAYFFISQALSGRDAALERLNRQVNELAELLSLERQANAELRLNVTQLSASLQRSNEERETLTLRLAPLLERAEQAEAALADVQRTIETDRETLELSLAEVESLRRDIETLRTVRAQLEADVGRLVAELEQRDQDIGALRDRRAELEAQLADEQERTLLAQKEVEAREVRLSELLDLYADVERDLEAERELSAGAQRQVALLNQQIAALREQLTRIEAALQASEAQADEQKVVIADLGRRLNLALASKVEELARYRSEFFGRLREVLGDRPYIRIVGDRFVFQSEVLFDSGSAELNEEGKLQLAVLAETLLRIARQIPPELEWILRVDGHTDKIPIATARYPSNWELSAARALSVAHFFIDQGVPPERLAAAGFGEFQPIDKRNDEIALRRNRRIELKLDQR
jgi:chemotaxis protein MotB